MSTYKLTYFNLRGLAEQSRLLFALAGKEYEDERIDREKWPELKQTTPLGQMPVLTVDGKQIPQSAAILRYLAREFGLYGKNNFENTMCDVILETINDTRPEFRKWMLETDQAKKEEISNNLKESVFPKFITFLEKTLALNGGDYFVGDGVTVADVAVFDVIQRMSGLWGEELMNMSPTVKAHCERIADIPNIKAWVEKRPKTDL